MYEQTVTRNRAEQCAWIWERPNTYLGTRQGTARTRSPRYCWRTSQRCPSLLFPCTARACAARGVCFECKTKVSVLCWQTVCLDLGNAQYVPQHEGMEVLSFFFNPVPAGQAHVRQVHHEALPAPRPAVKIHAAAVRYGRRGWFLRAGEQIREPAPFFSGGRLARRRFAILVLVPLSPLLPFFFLPVQ